MNCIKSLRAWLRGDLDRARADRDGALSSLKDASSAVAAASRRHSREAEAHHREAREGVHFLRNLRARIETDAGALARAAQSAADQLQRDER